MKVKILSFFLFLFAFNATSAAGLSSPIDHYFPKSFLASEWIDQKISLLRESAKNISPNVLKVSLTAYVHAAEKGMDRKQILTVIDYSRPSTEKRLWVFDLKNDKILYNTWASHGQNSGHLMATSFSNKIGSRKSSLGVFVTEDTYFGRAVGYALRINGLEPGFNDNAYKRGTVIHGRSYVSASVIRREGQLPRTYGCIAVNKDLLRPIISTIRDNTIIVAYYHDPKWLAQSKYVKTI